MRGGTVKEEPANERFFYDRSGRRNRRKFNRCMRLNFGVNFIQILVRNT
jgi:hypothetical protein